MVMIRIWGSVRVRVRIRFMVMSVVLRSGRVGDGVTEGLRVWV